MTATWGISAESHEPEEELVQLLHALHVRLLVRVVLQALRISAHRPQFRSFHGGGHAALRRAGEQDSSHSTAARRREMMSLPKVPPSSCPPPGATPGPAAQHSAETTQVQGIPSGRVISQVPLFRGGG